MRAALVLMLISMAAAPAAAQITFEQPTTPAAPPQTKPTNNPNDKIICERQEEIGSRLGGKKVCKTAIQWQEERRTLRNDVERVQQVINQSPSG